LAITDGVRVPPWQDARIHEARGAADGLRVAHHTLKRELLAAVAERTGVHLDADVLTLGFARRAAGYKRGDLIFSDPARIEPLLAGRLQLVFAGKAHPDDGEGRRLVATLVAMARRYPGVVVFVPDYDMALGRCLTRGVDVWLNNPRRPLEACGTSGMKAALNGALNFSVLDGWWPEACRHGENGWAIGDGGDTDQARELDALYGTLERETLPAWADRARWPGTSSVMGGIAFWMSSKSGSCGIVRKSSCVSSTRSQKCRWSASSRTTMRFAAGVRSRSSCMPASGRRESRSATTKSVGTSRPQRKSSDSRSRLTGSGL